VVVVVVVMVLLIIIFLTGVFACIACKESRYFLNMQTKNENTH
jgi:hypothetical protein